MSLIDPGTAIGWLGVLLIIVVFFSGVWNTAVGPTGGIVFVAPAATLSPAVAVPIQSIVQGVSGLYRAWVLRTYIEWQFVRLLGAGALPVFLVGLIAISYLNSLGNAAAVENTFRLVVGAFIVLTEVDPISWTVTDDVSALLHYCGEKPSETEETIAQA